MRWPDLIESALASLRQRVVRTALTVLGVLIGTTSVVTMVSLGLGLSKSMTESIATNASMTRLTIRPGGSQRAGNGMMPGSANTQSNSDSSRNKLMNIAIVNKLRDIDGVVGVAPVYQVNAKATVGKYNSEVSVLAMSAADMAAYGFKFDSGGLPQAGGGLRLVIGNKTNYNFGAGSDSSGQFSPPQIDWMNQQVFLQFTNDNLNSNNQSTTDPSATAAKRFVAPVSGVLAGNSTAWTEEDQYVFADLDEVLKALQKAFPGKALPGQPATADGKPKGNDFRYSMLYVTAVDAKRAESLTTELRDQGYNVSSNIELMKTVQQQFVLVQAVFGGIGFISLLVAAIGIANTMMMSVYERTKQIGVMKVLGASLGDIGRLFLVESAFIGLGGGLIGLLLSLLLSLLLNATLGRSAGLEISNVPPWLMLSALVFATLIGTLAGVAPAQRAMRLSPLAAIRTE